MQRCSCRCAGGMLAVITVHSSTLYLDSTEQRLDRSHIILLNWKTAFDITVFVHQDYLTRICVMKVVGHTVGACPFVL